MSAWSVVTALALMLGAIAVVLLARRARAARARAQAALERSFEERRALERAKAVADERERIFADLHDDVGAKLLTLIHSLEQPQHADLARSVLQDFRDIVSRSRDDSGSLLQVLGQIRDETEQRLDVAGVALAWEAPVDLPDPALDQAQALHLFRIVREAVSNALRHARPGRIRIRVRRLGTELLLDVTDDGPAGGSLPDPGRGVSGMRNRAAELHGRIDWGAGTEGGTKVLLRFPLPP